MSDATPAMQEKDMKSLLPKTFEPHDAKGRERAAASYISGLWLNDAGQLVIRFDDRDGENHYIGKSRVETALRKASITFDQVEVKAAAGSGPGLAIPAAFVERAKDALEKVPALEQPDQTGTLLLDAVGNAVKVANEIAMKERVNKDIAAQAAANAPKKPVAEMPTPAATHAAAVKGKPERSGSPGSLAV